MKNDLVTAVITTYKRETKTVERALKSVLNQTYAPVEILVVDDSPEDYAFRNDVKNMVEGYHIPCIAHERSMGACAARNTGLRLASGKYIGFLDDDDEWTPDKLEKQIRRFVTPDVALVYCKSKVFDDVSGKMTDRKTERHEGHVLKAILETNFIGSTSFPLIKTESLRAVGGFDVGMQSAQDYDLWIRIAERYAVHYVDEPLAVYHTHPGEQISKTGAKRIAGIERLIQKYRRYIDQDTGIWWSFNMALARAYGEAGCRKKAMTIWAKGVVRCPGKAVGNMKYLKRILG